MASSIAAIALITGRHGDDRWRSNDNRSGHRHALPISTQVSFAELHAKADDAHGIDKALSLQVALCAWAAGESSLPLPRVLSSASDSATNTAAGPFTFAGTAAGVTAVAGAGAGEA